MKVYVVMAWNESAYRYDFDSVWSTNREAERVAGVDGVVFEEDVRHAEA